MKVAPTQGVKVPVKTEWVHHYYAVGARLRRCLPRARLHIARGPFCAWRYGETEFFEYVGCASAVGGGLVFVPPTVKAKATFRRSEAAQWYEVEDNNGDEGLLKSRVRRRSRRDKGENEKTRGRPGHEAAVHWVGQAGCLLGETRKRSTQRNNRRMWATLA